MTKAEVNAPRQSASLIRKLWQYCNVLRDDGLSYPDYVEQLTYLLFLKMSDEQVSGPVPAEVGWQAFAHLSAERMHERYSKSLAQLGKSDGLLGRVFANARNKIRDPRKLRMLVTDLIGRVEWSALSDDVKGDAYEGLLEKNAKDTKSGAGQYFTPRPVIQAIVQCIAPRDGEIVCDPACGTGGFLLAAHAFRNRSPGPGRTPETRLLGVELVEEVARLATMNLLLHGILDGPRASPPILCADSLATPMEAVADIVLTNPPFGIRGSVTYGNGETPPANDELRVIRPDFPVLTANKQLNFLQHVVSLLKPAGRAAMVLPDNVLFEAGAAAAIRRNLLTTCNVHTLLRLPTGIFYAQGVTANVLFFDSTPKRTSRNPFLWVYDLRSGNRFSLKAHPLQQSDLAEFVELYRTTDRNSGMVEGTRDNNRWRPFETAAILQSKDARLDMDWDLPSEQATHGGTARLEELSRLIGDDLRRALQHIETARLGEGAPDRAKHPDV